MIEMEMKSNDKKIIDKVKFYKDNEIKAHVLTIPKPSFKNGLFVSDLENGTFFWFIDLRSSTPIRLFLSEIHDIEDYIGREEEDGN